MTTRRLHCTLAEYYADPCETPSLTQSLARVLLEETPRRAWYQHPRLGGASSSVDTEATTKGSLFDALILGRPELIRSIRADNWRTKAAREQRDEARALGLVPVLEREFVECTEMVETLLQLSKFDPTDGDSQVAIEFDGAVDGGTVQCRSLLDHVSLEVGLELITDIKTTSKALGEEKLARHMVEYGYDIQYAAYTEAIAALTGNVPEFRLIVFDLRAPYDATEVNYSESMRELGEKRWRRAKETWARCLKRNDWPRSVFCSPQAPTWALMRELESSIGDVK